MNFVSKNIKHIKLQVNTLFFAIFGGNKCDNSLYKWVRSIGLI